MDNFELLEELELDLIDLFDQLHNDGLSFSDILTILQTYTIPKLVMKSQAEQFLNK